MGQIRHGSATATEAIRRAIQHNQERLRAMRQSLRHQSERLWPNGGTGAPVEPMLPPGRRAATKRTVSTMRRGRRSGVAVSVEHGLPPAGDCLYSLQATIAASRAIGAWLFRPVCSCHGISSIAGCPRGALRQTPTKKALRKTYPTGRSIIDRRQSVQSAEGKRGLYVAIDRTSKFGYRCSWARRSGEERPLQPSWRPRYASCSLHDAYGRLMPPTASGTACRRAPLAWTDGEIHVRTCSISVA